MRLLTDMCTACELRPVLLHPDRVDMSPMEIAEYLCRVSSMIIVSGDKLQRLPKIVVDGVADYGSPSSRDTGRLLRCWDDGRRSMFNVMKAARALDNVEETFENADQIEAQEFIRVIKDLNELPTQSISPQRLKTCPHLEGLDLPTLNSTCLKCTGKYVTCQREHRE